MLYFLFSSTFEIVTCTISLNNNKTEFLKNSNNEGNTAYLRCRPIRKCTERNNLSSRLIFVTLSSKRLFLKTKRLSISQFDKLFLSVYSMQLSIENSEAKPMTVNNTTVNGVDWSDTPVDH